MAAEFYGYFDSITDDEREYDAAAFANILSATVCNGVTSHFGGGMKVTPAGGSMNTLVSYGGILINGYLYVLEDDGGGSKVMKHSVSGSAERIDRVVARLDMNSGARKITLALKTGTPGANPQPPALTRNGQVYELSLAAVMIRAATASVVAGDITDERPNMSLCGYAVPVWLKHAVNTVTHVANGGTGQTTIAAARNAFGLGNTTGALPIANGGTGQTTAAAARNALGLGNTTGALPVANGGTGKTTALTGADVPVSGSNATKVDAELLKKLNAANVNNTLTATAAGYALDARQGKALKALIDEHGALIFNGNISPGATVTAAGLTKYKVVGFVMSNGVSGVGIKVGSSIFATGSLMNDTQSMYVYNVSMTYSGDSLTLVNGVRTFLYTGGMTVAAGYGVAGVYGIC